MGAGSPGAISGNATGASTAWPHSLQNRLPGARTAPHCAQTEVPGTAAGFDSMTGVGFGSGEASTLVGGPPAA
jgi:hypothetical protein